MPAKKNIVLKKAKKGIKGEFIPPPDKSISHRAGFFSSIAMGKSIVDNFLFAEDTLRTVNAFRMLGVEINELNNSIEINGKGLHGLNEPHDIIDCGNSGTTIRLLTGLLSACPFFSVLTGDSSLRNRPMSRVIVPLRKMNATIFSRDYDRFPPIAIKGGNLNPIHYITPVASAQIKTSLILAGLYTNGTTEIEEPSKSRDHTERMLYSFGADINVDGLTVRVTSDNELKGIKIVVPGDISSAAFFIGVALLIKGSELVIKNVGINPTRAGILKAIKDMKGTIELTNINEVSGEEIADIHCKYTDGLRSVKIGKYDIPLLIDEFPILCILATQADGITEIRDAKELRVKESDRIKAMATELRKMGAKLEEFEDGLAIEGPTPLKGARVQSYNDHRIAMALAIAALIADGETTIDDITSVNISFPRFFKELNRLTV